MSQKLKKFVKTCLILPGENKYEFYKFFGSHKKLAVENKDFILFFRIHPQRDLKHYFKKIYFSQNIRISKEKFDDDVKRKFFRDIWWF